MEFFVSIDPHGLVDQVYLLINPQLNFPSIHSKELTERDECAFHEMMAHLPLFSHRNPERVLIVGGGDGGVLREVCRHPQVKHITVVEIDELVLKASKEHLRLATSDHFDDPRVQVVIEDAAKFLQDPAQAAQFDVIIGDTLDPLGPAESLFEPEFYEAMYNALRPEGIICTQGESVWIHLDLMRDLLECCADMFDYAEYATTAVPSYPSGQIGFVLARKGVAKSCKVPVRRPSFQGDLKFYTPQMHRAAFVLPHFVQSALEPLSEGNTRDDNDNDEFDEKDENCFLDGCQIQ